METEIVNVELILIAYRLVSHPYTVILFGVIIGILSNSVNKVSIEVRKSTKAFLHR